MNSFSSSLRSGLPAVGLGLMSVFGAMTAGTVLAPTAIAQAPKQVKSSPEFAKPMGEAQALMQAGKFSDALAKVEAAAPFAKAPQEKLGVEQFRTAIYANMKNNAGLVKSLEAQLALGVDTATASDQLPGSGCRERPASCGRLGYGCSGSGSARGTVA